MMNISLASYSGLGKRKNNEDACTVLENDRGLLAVVADGLGGQGNGEFASQQAISTLREELGSRDVDPEALEAAITKANADIFTLQEKHPGAQTTISAVWIKGNSAIAMHVGDTRIYQFRGDSVIYQSIDHTIAQLAVMSGDLKPEEIRTSKERNRLFRALGDSEPPKVGSKLLELEKGDRLLLCSDGFWEGILEKDMIRLAKSTESAQGWLNEMRRIAEPLASDNNTAIALLVS